MNTKALTPLIDADVICYRVGFAVKEDEPVEYALATVKNVLNNIMDRFPEATSRRVYLTGKGNFRDDIATILVYKGNRDPANKPHYYSEIREYLVDHQGAEVVEGQEADDAQGIAQWACKDKSTVIVGIDKDLYMIPGYHYNWVTGEFKYVTLAEANYNFFHQMLTGDRTDNILGCGVMKPGVYKTGAKKGQAYVKRDGVGPKEADELLAPCNKNTVEMAKVVKGQYKKYYGDAARAAHKENAALLWMRREEGQECPWG